MESGWIFPDGTEYLCNCFTVHSKIVQDFIQGLEFQNLEKFKKISQEIEDLQFEYGTHQLYENYAIRKLGWIKVGTSYLHIITYAGYDWQSELVKPYENLEYVLENQFYSSSNFMPINCNILSTIRKGKV